MKPSLSQKKRSKINSKISLLKKFVLVLLFLSFSFGSYSQKKLNNNVVKWSENYLLKNDYLAFLKDSLDSPSFSKDLTPWYHLFHIETQNFDSVKVSIYQFGVNSSIAHDMFLIYKQYKTTVSQFQVVEIEIDLKHTIPFYQFFNQYKKFSNKTKLICYEKIIGDKYYFDIMHPDTNKQ